MQRQFGTRKSGLACAFGLVVAALCLSPSTAHAQYKNSQFGLGGGVLVLLPANNVNFGNEQNQVSPSDGTAGVTAIQEVGACNGQRWPCGLPYRTLNPIVNFWFSEKLSDDSHWWFTGGLNLALLGSVTDPNHNLPGSTMVLIEPMGGPRFYFLTDDIKPYAELGLRIGFVAGAPSGIPTKLSVLPGIYATLGLEFMVARDVALVLYGRYTFLVIIDFHQENMFEGNAGVAFYF